MRTIKITGTGQLKVHPDVTEITMDITGLCPKYDEAVDRSAADTNILKNTIVELGFKRESIKSQIMNVCAEYENYDESGKTCQRMKGYKFRHQMIMEYDTDNELTGQILYALSHCNIKAEINFSYTLKDKESAKNILLANAVADSRKKAEIIADAAGVKLGVIQSVDYSWGNVEFRTASLCGDIGFSRRYAVDIEPEDIRLTENVTVTWEIS